MKPGASRPRRRRQRGFTLIEMIVATILLFVGVVATLVCISTATRSTGIAAEYTTAAILAQRHLAEIEAQPDQITAGDQQGEFGEEYPAYHWQQNIETTDTQGLYRVTVVITWQSGAKQRIATFATYLQQPPQPQQSPTQ